MIIIGSAALERRDAKAIQALGQEFVKKFGGTYNILHRAASRVGGLDVGFVPGAKGKVL